MENYSKYQPMINPELFTTLSYRDDINLRGIVIENEREAFHLACQNFTDRTSIRYKEYRKALSKKRRSIMEIFGRI